MVGAASAMTFRSVAMVGATRAVITNLTVDNIRVPTISSGIVTIQVVLFNANTSRLINSNFSNISLTNVNTNASSVFYLVSIASNSTYTMIGNTFSNITMRLSSTGVQHIIGHPSRENNCKTSSMSTIIRC